MHYIIRTQGILQQGFTNLLKLSHYLEVLITMKYLVYIHIYLNYY